MLYKDVHCVDISGRPSKWERLPIQEVDNWVEKWRHNGALHIYTTIQSFFSPTQKDGEDYECDFYADFDGESALTDVVTSVDKFINLGLESAYIRVWYSGSRGFHLEIPRQAFGALPSADMHKRYRLLGHKIELNRLSSWDEAVYRARNMWRVENTVNGKSGLYKIPLTVEELKTLSLGEIKELAKKSQPPHFDEYEGEPVKSLQNLYAATSQSEELDWSGLTDVKFEDMPPCILYLMDNGVIQLGTKNATMWRLAAYFKSQEYSKIDALGMLRKWIANIKPEFTHELLYNGKVNRELIAKQVIQVCNSVYASDIYGFSCAGILQIEGLSEKNLCTPQCRETAKGALEILLFDIFKAVYKGRRWITAAEVVGRRDASYTIPEKIHAWCSEPEGRKKCTACPLYGTEAITAAVTAATRNVLTFIEPSATTLTGQISKLLGVPTKKECAKWNYSVKERDVEVIYIAPRVSNESNPDAEYTRKPAYFFGYGLKPNQSYKLSGYTHTNTYTKQDKAVIDRVEPLSDTLSEFVFTDEMRKASEVFMPDEPQDVGEKHEEIVNAINRNYIRLWHREALIKAIDLCYHSVNRFWFQEELIPGWLDILIIGDTRQGKTKAAVSLMNYYNLGIRVSGESATRTGLLWTIPTKESEPFYIVWGVLPRYHKRLVIVDEIKTLVETKGFAELTDARSDGRVSVAKAVFGQAACETRVVWMTNTTGRKRMGTYQYPVLAIQDLIPDAEDISRFTFAVGVMSGEVDDTEINRPVSSFPKIDNPYSSEVCHNHILWVWKLLPDEIIFPKSSQMLTLMLANDMCKKYSQAIPLVEPGDFKLKLARTAAAVAARMYQHKESKLEVNEYCVQYAYEFIDSLYSGPPLRYDEYSHDTRRFVYDNEALEALAGELLNVISHHGLDAEMMIKFITTKSYLKVSEISAVLLASQTAVRAIINWLSGYKLLEPVGRSSYLKTEQGVNFFRVLVNKKLEDSQADNLF